MSYVTGATVPVPAQQYNDLLGWTYDGNAGSSTATALSAAATIFLGRIPLAGQISVTSVHAHLSTLAGSTCTHCFLALYRSDGTIIGQADTDTGSGTNFATRWASGGTTGLQTGALIGGPYTVSPLAANDFLWTAVYVGTSAGTLPAFARTISVVAAVANAGCTTARTRVGTIAQADTATLASITPGSITPTGVAYWRGIA